jgi:hypothetical protein
MKSLYVLFLLIFCKQDSEIELGTYSYRSNQYYETITLKDNSTFIYKLGFTFFNLESKGKYFIQNDSIILSSSPQKDRIIVYEDYKRNKKTSIFDLYDKNRHRIRYHLYITTRDNKVIELRDQWGKVKVNVDNVKSFYIIDTKGLSSPIYTVIGQTNYFEVYFETERVFENESWLLKDGKIIPRSFSGDLQSYYLEFKEEK